MTLTEIMPLVAAVCAVGSVGVLVLVCSRAINDEHRRLVGK